MKQADIQVGKKYMNSQGFIREVMAVRDGIHVDYKVVTGRYAKDAGKFNGCFRWTFAKWADHEVKE